MKLISSEQRSTPVSLSQAIKQGLADDGGLFIPPLFPKNVATWQDDYHQLVANCLQDYFVDDALQPHLKQICQRAYDFQPDCQQLDDNLFMLDLYHGPTLSFKDFGAQFLAQAMTTLAQPQQQLILVATSGDTGSAVAAAFHRKAGVRVIILYPDGMVSARQAHQLSCWGDNITTLKVQGDFDACQALVKQAFRDETLQKNYSLSTANSINIGRLLPQVAYYAYASLWYSAQHNTPISFIIPSGNIGNATACFWAREMGYPIKDILLAQNRNSAVYDYWHSGHYTPHATQATIANAMDVGNPSNFRRLQALYPDYQQFKQHVMVDRADDEEIKQAVQHCYQQYHHFICPHTAAAYVAYQRAPHKGPWMVVATAHPSKFDNVLAPLVDDDIPVPHRFQQQLSLPADAQSVAADLTTIKTFINADSY